MQIRSELSYVVSFPVPCANCGKEFLEITARLVKMASVTCPSCGAVLDLDGKEWRALRNSAKELCVGKQAPIAPVKQGS